MQIRTIKTLFFTAICCPFFVLAQQNTNSPYSAYGIGEIQQQGFAINNDLGGLGVALRPNKALNPSNPASLGSLTSTVFETGLEGAATQLSDLTTTQEFSSATLSYLALGFPIKEGLSISGGLLPYSFQGYETSQNIVEESNGDSLNASINHYGTGGINRAFFNLGAQVFRGLSIGVTGSMLFGQLNQVRDFHFSQANTFSRRDKYTNSLRDYFVDFGLQYQKAIEDKRATIGISYRPEHKFKTNTNSLSHTYEIIGSGEFIRDTTALVSGEASFVFPASYVFGLALEKEGVWLISGEYDYTESSRMSPLGAMNNQFRNTSQIKLGAAWTPDVQDVYNYFNTVQYRLGFHHHSGQLSLPATESDASMTDITETSISLGAGLPMRRSNTVAHVGVQLGKRGTKEGVLVEEKYIKFHVAFTFSDNWFTKRKID